LARRIHLRGFLSACSRTDRQKLLPDLNKINEALSHLLPNDKVVYIAPADGRVEINANFRIVPENLEQLLTREILTSTVEMILMIKKPDYLGQSQWEFRHGTHPITAKVLDVEWLEKFQSRQVDVRPGDSLRAMVQVVANYGYQNELVAEKYNIMQVKEVLPGDPEHQYTLLRDEEKS
jgi:hypothetical protein